MAVAPFDRIALAGQYPPNVANALLYLLFSGGFAERGSALMQARAFIDHEPGAPAPGPRRSPVV